MFEKTWLNDYIEQMEYEVQENKKEGYYESERNGELECPEDYYCLGLSHGEQKGVLDTLKLIKGELDDYKWNEYSRVHERVGFRPIGVGHEHG